MESISLTDQDKARSSYVRNTTLTHQSENSKLGESTAENLRQQRQGDLNIQDQQSLDDDSRSDIDEEQNDEVDELEPGAAIRKMQLLAQEIYNSTPGIAKCKLTPLALTHSSISKVTIKHSRKC